MPEGQAIRFLRIHRGWNAGDVRPVSHDPRGDQIDYQIAHTFVGRGVAEWIPPTATKRLETSAPSSAGRPPRAKARQ